MSFETLTPEFCYMNYSDNDVYSIQDTVTVTSDFTNPSYLWDNVALDEDLLATITAPSLPKTHLVEFGRDRVVSTVKVLNHNFASFKVELREGASTWTEVINVTGQTNNYYHFYQTPGTGYLLVTDSGDFLLTTSGLLLVSSTKYNAVRLTVSALQAGETDAELGEFYVGARAFKNSVGKVLDYRSNYVDFRKNTMSSWAGKGFVTRSLVTYNPKIRLRVDDFEEYRFLLDFVTLGGLYTFFPTGGEIGSGLSAEFDFNDIYLVQSNGEWSAIPWGMDAKQEISISLLETEYVST